MAFLSGFLLAYVALCHFRTTHASRPSSTAQSELEYFTETELRTSHSGSEQNLSDTSISVVVISDKPYDNRTSVLERTLMHGGFNTLSHHFSEAGKFSWAKRLEIMRHVVDRAASVNPDSVMLFLDAFDIITLGSEQELLDKFRRSSRDALFSCVTYPYPHRCEGLDWAQDGACRASSWGAQCKHWCRFACAGAFMGKAGMFAHIFSENSLAAVEDDQCYFNKVFAKHDYNVGLDSKQDIFFSTADLLKCSLERHQGRLRVINTGTLPSVIHFDATHPNAEHLESMWQRTLSDADGPLCGANSSCTDWCWDYDMGDMPMRLSPSDQKIFSDIGFIMLPEYKLYRYIWFAFGLLVGFVATATTYYCWILKSNDSKPMRFTDAMFNQAG